MKAKRINESLTKKDKKEQIINYSGIIEAAWQPLIKEAKDLYNITFDLENNDAVGKRVFRKRANLRIGQPVTSVVPIELWEAGGDWEWPLMYFRVCIESDHFLTGTRGEFPKEYPWDFERSEKNGGKYSGLGSRCFVIIPPRKAGNKYTECRDCEKVKYAAWQEEYPDFDKNVVKITDEDRAKAWKWLDKYLSDAIDKRYKRLDLEQNPLGMDPMDVIPEGTTPADPKDARTMDEIRSAKSFQPQNTEPEAEGPELIKEELSGSEAVYGFAGWLTTRDKPVTMSSKDDAACVARLVADFVEANELEDPVDNWHEELNHPIESTNEAYKDKKLGEDCKKAIKNSRKIPKEMKDELLSLVTINGIHGTYYNNGKVFRLNAPEIENQGVSLGADKDGYFVFTHRARSKSKESIDKIPQKDIKFISSTG